MKKSAFRPDAATGQSNRGFKGSSQEKWSQASHHVLGKEDRAESNRSDSHSESVVRLADTSSSRKG